MAITDSLEKVDKINLQYVVQSGVSYEGIFKLITKNNINAVVNYEGANTSLKVNNNARFAIDVVLPEVAVSGGESSEAKKEYTANVRISEDNLKEVLYYATKCSMSQNGVCLDSFDDEHPYVTSLGNSKGANIKDVVRNCHLILSNKCEIEAEIETKVASNKNEQNINFY